MSISALVAALQLRLQHLREWLPRYVWRWAILILVIIAINLGATHLLNALSETVTLRGRMMLNLTILVLLLLYALLLALPFVPGVEIGVSVMVMQGSEVAPFVYLATVLGLSLSFFMGRALGHDMPCQFLRTLGLVRTCKFIEKTKALSREQRLKLLQRSLPHWIGKSVLKYRYVVMALALNLPGNSLVGGGGGIALVAGLSRLFSPLWTLVMILIAVSPVPILVYFWGPGLLK